MEHQDVFARLIEQFAVAERHPDREASIRCYVESLENGAPNYDELAPATANDVRQELPQLLQFIKLMGPLKSISYKHGTEDGADVHLVTFDHGEAEWTIGPLTADGKVQKQQINPL
jgi:hypothetical protein